MENVQNEKHNRDQIFIDLIQFLMQEPRKIKKTSAREKFESIKLNDKKIVSEDEEKFQEYFLKEKNKTLRSETCER